MLRPTPSGEEFLGHFERRRLVLGDCGRAWGSSCIHEHSCIRCSPLRVDPAQKQRLEDIRGNLTARITEAEREGLAGEAEGLNVSLAAGNNKLAQIELSLARRAEAVTVALRACAAGLYPLEAGVALLAGNGTFLRREDFTSRFITTGTSISDCTTLMAAIDWDAAMSVRANNHGATNGIKRARSPAEATNTVRDPCWPAPLVDVAC